MNNSKEEKSKFNEMNVIQVRRTLIHKQKFLKNMVLEERERQLKWDNCYKCLCIRVKYLFIAVEYENLYKGVYLKNDSLHILYKNF